MFDLFRSREKTTRYLLGGLLTLVAVSMVVTLIPGFGTGAGTGLDQTIAEVGDEKISLREVQMGVNDSLRGRQIPPELISVYAPQIVDQVVKERAIAYYAKELGYKITDADVAQVIQMMIPQLFEGGKFVGKEAYAQFLASNNTSISEFERNARMRAAMRRLESVVLEGMIVTPQEIEREYRSRNEKVVIDYVKIDPAKVQAEIKVTPEEIRAHYETSKANYRTAERRTARLLLFDEAKISESLNVDEAVLRRYYDNNKDQFRSQERVRARHILVKAGSTASKEEKAAAKTKAEGLLKQLKGGGDFAELAKKNSDDPGSAAKGGELDWYARGQLAKAFEDKAFAMKPKETSDLVETEFGYHIIQTLEKEEARLKPFDEVKEQLKKDQVKEQVFDKMAANADQARAALLKNAGAAEQLAGQLGAAYTKIDAKERGKSYPLLAGPSVEMDDALFELKKAGDVTEVVQLPGNKLALAVLDSIEAPRQAELSEVEEQIRTTIRGERAQRLLAERSSSVMERVKGNGGDLSKAVAGMGLDVKSTAEFGRDGQVEGIGSANFLEEAFRRDPGAVFGPVNVSGANYICKIKSKTPADLSKLAAQRYDILLRLKSQKAQQRRDMFEEGLLEYMKQKKIVKIHKETVDRLVNSYKNS